MIVNRYTVWCLYLAAINIITFTVYGWDKRAACREEWRISEKTLFLLTAVGGSLGAALAMKFFHHKTRKIKFLIFVPLCIFVHGILIWKLVV